jgi:hypothetical protein
MAISSFYCPSCGERALSPRELTVRGLVEQAVEAFTSIDGRLLRSFGTLVTSPGALTMAYLAGRRKPYIGPVSLFLIANVLFFATESLTGGTVFTTPLASHLHSQPWDGLATTLVSHRLQTLHQTLEAYTPGFDRAVARNARSFIILMALSFSILPRIAFRGSRWPFAAHAAFALHLYAFILLLFCIATSLLALNAATGSVAFSTRHFDAAISLTLLVVCAIYLYIATGVVYGGSAAVRALKAGMLTVGVAVIVLGYRFALLIVTLYTT